jgi:hypothetical protein
VNDACVGDEFVHSAERCDAGVDHADDLLLVADIDLVTDCAATDFECGRVGRRTVDVRAEHAASLGAESLRNRQADPGAGPGDDRGLAGQV